MLKLVYSLIDNNHFAKILHNRCSAWEEERTAGNFHVKSTFGDPMLSGCIVLDNCFQFSIYKKIRRHFYRCSFKLKKIF